jgi:hypothetical protein
VTLDDLEDARDTLTVDDGDDEVDFEEFDQAVNMLRDAQLFIEHIAALDKKSNFLTRNRRLGMTGLLEEMADFLAVPE